MIVYLLGILALTFKITDTQLDVCKDGSFKVEYFKIGRIQPGKSLDVEVKGVFTKKVTKGKLHTQLLVGPIPIIDRLDDLCSAVGEVDLHCPLDGDSKINKQFDVPKEVLPGTYVLRVDAIDQDNGKVTCISGHLTVEHGD
eukprot:NODE_429_length_8748_cov_0.280148.p6 type:complete len:141 gc:universal NODE_429_length_8748_cov_0.280148:8430-8008(-)